jgi:protein-S-isoprenylcysteine O-methyltransferase Ste14
MKRVVIFVYGVLCYLVTLASIAGGVVFFGNFVQHSVDAAPRVGWLLALAINAGLALVFAVQHSGMARPGFKRWWTRFIPEPIERATYCLASCVAVFALYAWWQPMGPVVWQVDGAAASVLTGIYLTGWAGLVYTTFLIDHFDLFGLRQVTLALRGRPYEPLVFKTASFYRWVRHPIYVAWLTIFWAAPVMTLGHLIFSLTITAYVLLAIQLEERDLEDAIGGDYAAYRQTTPMLIPRPTPALPKTATSGQSG